MMCISRQEFEEEVQALYIGDSEILVIIDDFLFKTKS